MNNPIFREERENMIEPTKLSKAMIDFFKKEIQERGFEVVEKEWLQAEFEVFNNEHKDGD